MAGNLNFQANVLCTVLVLSYTVFPSSGRTFRPPKTCLRQNVSFFDNGILTLVTLLLSRKLLIDMLEEHRNGYRVHSKQVVIV
jgi:hypothetical protein